MHVLTGNGLRNGQVVFLKQDGAWAPGLANARVFQKAEKAGAEALAREAEAACLVIATEVVDVMASADGALRLARLRERIRLEGPTVQVRPPFPQGGKRGPSLAAPPSTSTSSTISAS